MPDLRRRLLAIGLVAIAATPAYAAKIPIPIFFGSPTGILITIVIVGAVLLASHVSKSRAKAKLDQAMPFIQQGDNHQRLGEHANAIDAYGNALRIFPKLAPVQLAKARSLIAMRQLDQAIAEYSSVITADRQRHDAVFLRGTVFLDQQNYDAAIADFTRALKREKAVVVYYFRGLAYARKANHKAAIKDFSAALAINPKLAEAYVRRAESHAALGDAQRSAADLEAAAKATAAAQAQPTSAA